MMQNKRKSPLPFLVSPYHFPWNNHAGKHARRLTCTAAHTVFLPEVIRERSRACAVLLTGYLCCPSPAHPSPRANTKDCLVSLPGHEVIGLKTFLKPTSCRLRGVFHFLDSRVLLVVVVCKFDLCCSWVTASACADWGFSILRNAQDAWHSVYLKWLFPSYVLPWELEGSVPATVESLMIRTRKQS